MNVNLKMRGTQEFHDALRRLPREVKVQVLANATDEVSRGFLADITAGIPVDTGDLKEAATREERNLPGTRDRAGFLIGFRQPGFYWSWVEFGTKHGVKAQPFVRPAFDRWRRRFRKVLRKHMEKAVGVSMRKARVRRK